MGSQQVTLSVQLIYFMNWVIQYGRDDLRKLVRSSLKQDLVLELESLQERDISHAEDRMQETVLTFMLLLESVLIEEFGVHGTKGEERFDAAVSAEQEFDARKKIIEQLFLDWKPNKNEPVN